MKYFKYITLLFFIHSLVNAQDHDPYLNGIALMSNQQLHEAIDQFSIAIRQTSRNADMYIKRADCYYRLDDYRNAILDLKKAEKHNKYYGSYLLAKSYAAIGMIDSSIHYLELHLQSPDKLPESYIKLDPDFADLEKTREWTDLWKKDWYSDFEILLAEIKYLVKTREYHDALNLADQNMEQYQHRHELHAARASIFVQLGSQKAAISGYSEAIEKSNKVVSDYYIQRSQAFLKTNDFKDALADLSRAITLEEENLELYLKRSKIRNELGQYNEALKDISFFIQYFPEDHAAYFQKGYIYTSQGNYLKALVWYNKALEIDSSKPEYFIARGDAYLNTDTYSYAIRDYSMALDLEPRNHNTYVKKGLARYYLNDLEGACYDWKKAEGYGSFEASDYLEKYCR